MLALTAGKIMLHFINGRPHKPFIEHSLENAFQLIGKRVGLGDNKQVMNTNQPSRKINGKLFKWQWTQCKRAECSNQQK